jgi:hypothetical protein
MCVACARACVQGARAGVRRRGCVPVRACVLVCACACVRACGEGEADAATEKLLAALQ